MSPSADRYEQLEVIGSGGMATVWRARDTLLGRVVAMKRPHPAPPDSEVYARFERESRMAATVSHPNLVTVFDVGADEIGPYLIMEFIDAPSLAATTVGPDGIALIGSQIAAAVAQLHAVGIVHRDIKPANVLMAPGGAKLTDFGIALFSRQRRRPDAGRGDPRHTGVRRARGSCTRRVLPRGRRVLARCAPAGTRHRRTGHFTTGHAGDGHRFALGADPWTGTVGHPRGSALRGRPRDPTRSAECGTTDSGVVADHPTRGRRRSRDDGDGRGQQHHSRI